MLFSGSEVCSMVVSHVYVIPLYIANSGQQKDRTNQCFGGMRRAFYFYRISRRQFVRVNGL